MEQEDEEEGEGGEGGCRISRLLKPHAYPHMLNPKYFSQRPEIHPFLRAEASLSENLKT